jgi:hypothetical protein
MKGQKNSQEQNGVISSRLSQRLDDKTRPTSNICSPMTSDLRLVSHTSQRDALEGPIEGFGDGLSKGCFSGTRRTHEPVL